MTNFEFPAEDSEDLQNYEDSDSSKYDEGPPDLEERSEEEEEKEHPEDFAERVEEFKRGLQTCMNNVQHDGNFSAFHTSSQYTNPGLYLNGIGAVGLPLSGRDAQAIAAVCK
jgi:hypothetical protein